MPEDNRMATVRVGLPPKPFMYTLDQISSLLSVKVSYLEQRLLFFEGRSVGIPPRDKLKAFNIAPKGQTPVWRVPERSLVIFLRHKGIRYYTRGL